MHRFSILLSLLGAALAAAASNQTLIPWKFAPLPLGSVKAKGWLLGELQTMSDGLAGHEHDFYVYVNESSWLGPQGNDGVEYSNLNEGLPYWFNGLVPLAYHLDDDRLKGQVHEVANTVLGYQTSDGWIGPELPDERNFWARIPFFMGLTQLAEANSTWEQPVLDALHKFMDLSNTMLSNNSWGLSNCNSDYDCTWGEARIHDMIVTVQWMLENHPSDQDSKLWDNMNMFYSGTNFKWDAWYNKAVYLFNNLYDDPQTGVSGYADYSYVHGVNVGQGLKASAVIYRFNHNESLVNTAMDGTKWTFNYHGAPSGTILADEREDGLSPLSGSELCTAVETTYSLAYLYQALGTNYYADRAELAAFNAIPAMLTGDMWAHQYMEQPNQPLANQMFGPLPDLDVFSTANTGVANTFGMEPVYPCCTVNHPQGFPKFLSNSWATVGDSGLAHMLLSPSTVSTNVGGGNVQIDCETDYPFANTLTYTVNADKAFDFYVRVPSWSQDASSSISLGGSSQKLSPDSQTGMHKVSVPSGQSTVKYSLGAKVQTENRANNTIAVYYGNIHYALEIGSNETTSLPHAYFNATGPGIPGLPSQVMDHYFTNTTAWAVAIDPSTLKYSASNTTDLPVPIFDIGAPSNHITAMACEIDWPLYQGVTPSYVPTDRTCQGSPYQVKLVPYGSAKIHMSELPTIDLSSGSS